ncbi:MAG: hypothetical protein ACK6CT_05120 [Planctomycetia bacterium]|jgi:hypothetical protein
MTRRGQCFWMAIAVLACIAAGFGENRDAPATKASQDRAESRAEMLRKTPETLLIQGRQLAMTGSVIRNRMPTIGRPPASYLVMRIAAGDGKKMPSGLRCVALHGISGEEIWTQETIESRPAADALELVARQAPDWKQPIDVVVVLEDAAGTKHLLRAAGVEVMEVW